MNIKIGLYWQILICTLFVVSFFMFIFFSVKDYFTYRKQLKALKEEAELDRIVDALLKDVRDNYIKKSNNEY